MSHPSSQQLEDLVAGRLDVLELEDVAAHLNECASCLALANRFASSPGELLEELRATRTLAAPAGGPCASVGSRLGHFRLLGKLGEGGFGVVWLARDSHLDRNVALKLSRFGPFAPDDLRERFVRESKAAAMLDHPNILTVHDAGEIDGTLYLVSAYCRGPNLAEWLRSVGPGVSSEMAGTITLVLADAVAHAHERGVIHRDLKPANILLEPTQDSSSNPIAGFPYRVKVTDFGLAKITGEAAARTASHCLLGTAAYMAPEQARGDAGQCGPKVDIYALGAILYEMLTQRPPFQGDTTLEVVQQVANVEPVAPRALKPSIDRDIETICLKCMTKDARHRYESAASLAEDLRRYVGGEPIRARPLSRLGRVQNWCRRYPVVASLLTALVLLAVVVLSGTYWGLMRLTHERHQALTSSRRAEQAEAVAKRQLFDAYLAQAQASNRSDWEGRRSRAIESLRRARKIATQLELDEDAIPLLRDEAIVSLTLTDIDFEPLSPRVPTTEAVQEQIRLAPDHRSYLRVAGQSLRLDRCERNSKTVELESAPDTLESVTARWDPSGRFVAVKQILPDGCEWLVWEIPSRSIIRRIPVAAGPAILDANLDFAPDSTIAFAISQKGELLAHSLADDRAASVLHEGLDQGMVRVSPRRRFVAVALANELVVLDAASGAEIDRHTLPGSVAAMEWNPAHEQQIAYGIDNELHLHDVVGEHADRTIGRHDARIHSIAFRPQGDILAASDLGETTRLYDLATDREIIQGRGFAGSFCRAGLTLSSPARSDQAGLWHLVLGDCRRTVELPCGAWSADSVPGTDILLAATPRGLFMLSLATGGQVGLLESRPTFSVLVDPDAEEILASGAFGLATWSYSHRTESEQVRVEFGSRRTIPVGMEEAEAGSTESDQPPLRRAALLERSAIAVLFADRNRAPVVVSRKLEGNLVSLPVHYGVDHIAASDDGRWVATGTHNGRGVIVSDARTGELVTTLPSGDAQVAFRPDSHLLAVGTGTRCDFYQVGTWQRRFSLPRSGSGGLHSPVAFTPDGRTAAVLESTSDIVLIDTASGRRLARLPSEHTRILSSLRFAHGARYLLAATEQNSIDVWDLEALRRELRSLDLDWASDF